MAHSVGIKLTIDDFQAVSDRIPFLADIKPSGKYVMEDVYKIGGIPSTPFPPRSVHVCTGLTFFFSRNTPFPFEEQVD